MGDVKLVGPGGIEIVLTSVSGADFSSIEAAAVNSRSRGFGIAVTRYDDDPEVFVSASGEIGLEVFLWLVDHCVAVLNEAAPPAS